MAVSRRRFLMVSFGGGAAAGGLAALGRKPALVAHTRQSHALGSEVMMTVLGVDAPHADRALTDAFAELETVESVMSLYRPDSQICRLNRERVLANPHPYLVEVLSTAAHVARLSDGAFDVTVQPLWELFASAKKLDRLPTNDEVASVRAAVNWRAVEVRRDEIRLRAPATAITLNGIAQGFAADRAAAALRRHGIAHALVNTGEVGTLGRKLTGELWSVGVQHPRHGDAFVALAALEGRSLSTSGDYATTFSADFVHHHIFNPRTGRSPQEVASVSIVAPTGLQADALSTAAMVLGPERTFAQLESLPDVDALFVLKDGREIRTRGFPATTEA